MYNINPQTVYTFLQDRTIRLPRFQRKRSWNEIQNMKLAISVFKNYPMGVTIINKEDYKSKTTRWLLDGRQRRTALELMLENPENIYVWAKKMLKLKNSDQPQDIEDKFWEVIDEYLNHEESSKEDDDSMDEGQEVLIDDEELIDDDEELIDDDFEEDDNYSNASNSSENRKLLGNLDELLFIIKTIHNKQKKHTGFSKPFNFIKIIDNLIYVEADEIMSGKKLTNFIQQYFKFLTAEKQNENEGSFIAFIKSFYKLNAKEEKSLIKIVSKNWSFIKNSNAVVDIIENRLREATIGIIQTENISATDSQMIFKLINDEGTPLTAVEILSAKPTWNILVKNPSDKLKNATKSLYTVIDVPIDEEFKVVRWDYPATLYDRIEKFDSILPELTYNKKLDKKLTIGFKILSGVYEKGIKKEDVSNLSKNKDISWSTSIDDFIKDLCDIGKILSESPYFLYLKSWNKSFMEITSDAITLNFIFTVYQDFLNKGKPIGANKKTKQFINNATILADKLVYEYVTKKWRGSSDSKIEQNIKKFGDLPEKFEPVENDLWLSLLKKINDSHVIDDDPIKFNLMKSLVYHQIAISQTKGPNDKEVSVDVDHIIPQKAFDTSTGIKDAELLKHSLFNLCVLPKKQNIKKSDKFLNEVKGTWLIDYITQVTGIKQSEFKNYSSVLNWEGLRVKRRGMVEEDFLENRKTILNN
ncbi:DUF262 domain-containing protein [Flavobacteriaceae bacterium]|nr:DUF262 domain-containing protein [Flavobacteriaceae bacterium]